MGIRRKITGLTGVKNLLLTQLEGAKLNKHRQKPSDSIDIWCLGSNPCLDDRVGNVGSQVLSSVYLVEEVFKHKVVVVIAGGELHVLQREDELSVQRSFRLGGCISEQSRKTSVSEFMLKGINILAAEVVPVGGEAYLVDKLVHQQVVLYDSGL